MMRSARRRERARRARCRRRSCRRPGSVVPAAPRRRARSRPSPTRRCPGRRRGDQVLASTRPAAAARSRSAASAAREARCAATLRPEGAFRDAILAASCPPFLLRTMPIYEYSASGAERRRKRSSVSVILLSQECPRSAGPLRKKVSAPAFQFKGTGWYVTDYARKGGGEVVGRKSSEESGASGDSTAATTRARAPRRRPSPRPSPSPNRRPSQGREGLAASGGAAGGLSAPEILVLLASSPSRQSSSWVLARLLDLRLPGGRRARRRPPAPLPRAVAPQQPAARAQRCPRRGDPGRGAARRSRSARAAQRRRLSAPALGARGASRALGGKAAAVVGRSGGRQLAVVNPQSGVLSPTAFLARPLPIQHHPIAAHGPGDDDRARRRPGSSRARSGWRRRGVARRARASLCRAASRPGRCCRRARRRRGRRGWRSRCCGRAAPRGRRVAAAPSWSVPRVVGQSRGCRFRARVATVWAVLLPAPPAPTACDSGLLRAIVLGRGAVAPVVLRSSRDYPARSGSRSSASRGCRSRPSDCSPRTWFLPRDAVLLQAPLGSQAFGRPYSGLFQGTLNWAEAGAGYAGLLALAGRRSRSWRGGAARAAVRRDLGVGLVVAAGFLPLRAALAAVPGAALTATGRLLPLVVLGFVVAGALGLDGLLRGGSARWRSGAARGRASIAALLDCGPVARVGNGSALWSAIAACGGDRGSGHAAPAALVAGVLLVDLGPWALLQLPRGDTAAFYPATAAIETAAPETAAPGGPWRAAGEDLAVYPSLLPSTASTSCARTTRWRRAPSSRPYRRVRLLPGAPLLRPARRTSITRCSTPST